MTQKFDGSLKKNILTPYRNINCSSCSSLIVFCAHRAVCSSCSVSLCSVLIVLCVHRVLCSSCSVLIVLCAHRVLCSSCSVLIVFCAHRAVCSSCSVLIVLSAHNNKKIILLISFLKMSAMQGWERAIYTLSVQRPQPHNTNLLKKRRERENSRRQKERDRAACSQ